MRRRNQNVRRATNSRSFRNHKASQGLEGNGDKEQQQLRAEVAQLKGAVAAADQARVTAEKQRDDTQAKFAEANNHIVALERERDDALSQLKSAKESEQRFQSLVAEKNDLQQKLAIAEEKVRKLSEGDPKSSREIGRDGATNGAASTAAN